MDELKLMPYDKINVDKMMYEDEQDDMIDVAVESDEVIFAEENIVIRRSPSKIKPLKRLGEPD